MSRKGKIKDKRILKPDPRFSSLFVSQFVNIVMQNGKKSLAQRIVYQALELASVSATKRWSFDQLNVFFSELPAQKEASEVKEFCGIDEKTSFDVSKLTPTQLSFFLLIKAVRNVQPLVEVRSKRVGGKTYQVPSEIGFKRGKSLAIRWIRDAYRKRSAKTSAYALAQEVIDACDKQGGAFKRYQDTFKMAKANQALLHFKLNKGLFE